MQIKYLCYEQYKVMFGLVDNNVKSVKFIGRFDINMDANLRRIIKKSLAHETDDYYYPYFNDAKELFRN